jgi:hypothetical protein
MRSLGAFTPPITRPLSKVLFEKSACHRLCDRLIAVRNSGCPQFFGNFANPDVTIESATTDWAAPSEGDARSRVRDNPH